MQKYYVRVKPNGDTYWCSDPEFKILHRENGPAVEYADGYKAYLQNGKLHRIDGPAIEFANGYTEYFIAGKRHRLDGPARIWSNDDEEYWIDGVEYTKEEFLAKTNPVKELTVAEVEKLLGYQVKIVK